MFRKLYPIVLLFSIYVFVSCGNEGNVEEDFEINVHLPVDPPRLNPMVGNPTIEITEINSLIFLPLAHYNPETYELDPILIKELPPGEIIEDGQYAGGISYEFEILQEAEWSDGAPVTGHDYLFTLKMAKNPVVEAASWRSLFRQAVEVEINEAEPRKFKVVVGEYFHIAREAMCTFELLPKHIYDPEAVMDRISLDELNNEEALQEIMAQDSSFANLAREFNSTKFTHDVVSGCGPYELQGWEADQYIVLNKKEDYWGNQYPERPSLRGVPNKITFRVIADENAAITLLKDGSIDFMRVKDANAYDNLKSSENFDSQFEAVTLPMGRYYYIGLNNRVPELQSKKVRRALAHLVDVDNIINNLENGYGIRQPGAIMSSSPFYNETLEPIDFDVQKAVDILNEENWEDSNGNGIRDKEIGGDLVELEIEYVASDSPLGQKVGLLFQDAAEEAGVRINLVVKERRQFGQAIRQHEFEASPQATGLSLAPYDPYQRWHSDNSVSKGNYFGYINESNDSEIETIRNNPDKDARMEAYRNFQQLMYDEQPVIFLYSPTQKFVLSKDFKGLFSNKRPGYFIGSFEVSQ